MDFKKENGKLESMFNELYEKCPDLKEQAAEDERWRQNRVSELVNLGKSYDYSVEQTWFEYWQMVKDRDNVEFNLTKLNLKN